MLEKGFVINNRYTIKHHIDSFSFCKTYSAVDSSTSKLVNLSVYNSSDIARDDLDNDGQLREVGFLKLSIDGLPELIEYGSFNNSVDKFTFISTKFISGESAMDRIKRVGPLSDIESVSIIESIIKISSELHSYNPSILLNGLSPDNIMFDLSTGTEKIILRNLINLRRFDEDFKYSYVDGVSPYLLANECYNDVFTLKSDIFNLGALLYQLIEGIPPWYDENKKDFATKESVDSFLESRSYNLKFFRLQDDHLKNVITKSLSVKTDDRFNSVEDFKNYLMREKIITSSENKPRVKPKKIGRGFDDIGGMNDLKQLLRSKVLDVLSRPEHFKKYGVTIPNGMLLYGPPGCGKTFISEKFCEEAGFNFYLIKPSDLSSIYVSGGEEKIGGLFSEAEKNSPSVICFDEVDALMPKRNESMNQSISSKVNEFLAQINKCSERGIFVIATTNKPNLIDEAILRTGRLEIQVYIGPPDFEARKSMFKILLSNRFVDIGIDYDKLAQLTENYVSSDLDFISNKAAHSAAIQDTRITTEIVEDIIKSFKPSISKKVIDSYENSHQKFSEEETKDKHEPRIGFKK